MLRLPDLFARRVSPLPSDVLKDAGYYCVMDQAEFATDVLFADGSTLKPLFESWLNSATRLQQRLHTNSGRPRMQCISAKSGAGYFVSTFFSPASWDFKYATASLSWRSAKSDFGGPSLLSTSRCRRYSR